MAENFQKERIMLNDSGEVNLKELVLKLGIWWAYLKTQWKTIALAGIIGGGIGFIYVLLQPITYTAKTTFVVEESKGGSNLGGLASLAGQFGVDVMANNSIGVMGGDNILLYFKSESLAREVLMTSFEAKSKKSIADQYIQQHGFYDKWAKSKKIGKVSFPISSDGVTYSRLQDSLINFIINQCILKNQLEIGKIDKKAGFIQLSVSMEDEKLAKVYCDKLVEIALRRYVNLKTARQQKIVEKLQSRVDSISAKLKSSITNFASLQTNSSTMDFNPLYKTNTLIETELTGRDKTILNSIYIEVVKNLEIAKFNLSQETPLIQIVDQSKYPLKKNDLSFLKFFLFGSLVSAFFCSFFFLLKLALQ